MPETARSTLRGRFRQSHCVALYLAVGSEVDAVPLIDEVIMAKARLALPRVEGRGPGMQCHLWSPEDPLETAAFGFRQPPSSAPLATPDLLIVPLLGFDHALNRLGQGAGHYDRYFAKHPNCLKIGLSWASQEVELLPVEPWDVPLDAVLTEKGWRTRPGSGMEV
jgi:5-formyltetrahydrofolate cyclo-ligase